MVLRELPVARSPFVLARSFVMAELLARCHYKSPSKGSPCLPGISTIHVQKKGAIRLLFHRIDPVLAT